ncbi:OmpA family protein [Rhodopila sp.]|uniref:OmpA family protein n=1 Tax=Rhodopila sp. TaxID=2480087 RepID=UPI003D10BD15
MKLKNILLATTLIAAPLSSQAQTFNPPPVTGPYVSFGGGGNFLQNEHIVGPNGNTSDASLASHFGGVAVGALGYGLGNGLRLEFEGDYRHNGFSNGKNFGYPAGAGGGETKFGPMFNVVYDLTGLIPSFPYVAPYAGVGVGYQWTRLNSFHTYNDDTGFPRQSSDDSRGALAYQAIIGAVIPFRFLPQLATTIEYRFLGTADRSFDATVQTAPGVSDPNGRVKLGNDFNHALLIGIRYDFGAPTPPPPAAPSPVAVPAPAAARSYLVFFDWDKATLTDRARAIVKEAADNSTRVQYTRIEVNGYTDTSGTPRYNLGLSERRARAVAGELIRDGVPQNAIDVHGLGETHLLVSTGPGVREPQNRRVEIIVR